MEAGQNCSHCSLGSTVWTKCDKTEPMTNESRGVPRPGTECPWVLLAAKDAKIERLLKYVAQFVTIDYVGDDSFVLGAVIRDEEFADSLFPHVDPGIRDETTYDPWHNNQPEQVILRAALAEGGGE